MQLAAQRLGSAEEDARLGRAVDLADAAKDHVPVGAAEVGRGAETRDGVLVGVGVIDHDVGCVVVFDFGGQVLFARLAGDGEMRGGWSSKTYGVDLDVVLQVLRLDGK